MFKPHCTSGSGPFVVCWADWIDRCVQVHALLDFHILHPPVRPCGILRFLQHLHPPFSHSVQHQSRHPADLLADSRGDIYRRCEQLRPRFDLKSGPASSTSRAWWKSRGPDGPTTLESSEEDERETVEAHIFPPRSLRVHRLRTGWCGAELGDIGVYIGWLV